MALATQFFLNSIRSTEDISTRPSGETDALDSPMQLSNGSADIKDFRRQPDRVYPTTLWTKESY